VQWSKRSTDPTTAADLRFEYERIAKTGVIDQTLSIKNRGSSAVALRLAFVPLDVDGQELRGVTTTTAYGTEAGNHVIPAKFTDIDILAFHGPGFRDVADVRVDVQQVMQVPSPKKVRDVVLTDRIDTAGNVVPPGYRYAYVRLTNTSREAVAVRVALIEYEEPWPGQSQQAIDVRPLGDLIEVPGQGTTTIPGPTHSPEGFVSVKAYYSW
jgi:hypothetical protein